TTADRDFSSDTGDWTGTPSWHIVGGTANKDAPGRNAITLSSSIFTPQAATSYQLVFSFTTTASSSGDIFPNIGGVVGVHAGQAPSDSKTSTQIITTTNTDPLTFTPATGWYGTIDTISVKKVIGSNALANLLNSNGTVGIE